MPLVDALTGFDLQIDTLDGRLLCVPIRDRCVQTGDLHVVPGEGMPRLGAQPGARGDLIISFMVQCPARPLALTDEQHETLRQLLALSP